jgi:hypothetical protein
MAMGAGASAPPATAAEPGGVMVDTRPSHVKHVTRLRTQTERIVDA